MNCPHIWGERNGFLTCQTCGVTPSPERITGQWPTRDYGRILFPKVERC